MSTEQEARTEVMVSIARGGDAREPASNPGERSLRKVVEQAEKGRNEILGSATANRRRLQRYAGPAAPFQGGGGLKKE